MPGATSEQRLKIRAALLDPFLERSVLIAVFLVPAKQRLAAWHGNAADEIADVGEKTIGFRHAGGVNRKILPGHGDLTECLSHLPGIAEGARQLVGAEEVISDGDARVAAKNMGAEMGVEGFNIAFRQSAGRNREARPGENGRGKQLDVVFQAIDVEATGFGA